MPIRVERDTVVIGQLGVSFHRTLRIPDDGKPYPLPPGLGRFPLQLARDLGNQRPTQWDPGDLFLPMYRREALWLGFTTDSGSHSAVQIGIGGVNAISGQPWHHRLGNDPQNYLVCPDQPWLDGVMTESALVRQFLAVPARSGYPVDEQLPDADMAPGLHLRVYAPHPERLADIVQMTSRQEPTPPHIQAGIDLGVGVGGTMRQRIYPDRYGISVWNASTETTVTVHLVSPESYRHLTGEEPPPSPVSAGAYTEAGLPWFELDDEDTETLPPTPELTGVSSVRDIDLQQNVPPIEEEQPVQLESDQVKRVHRHSDDHSGGHRFT